MRSTSPTISRRAAIPAASAVASSTSCSIAREGSSPRIEQRKEVTVFPHRDHREHGGASRWPALRAGWIERRVRKRTPPHSGRSFSCSPLDPFAGRRPAPSRDALCVLCGPCVETPYPPPRLGVLEEALSTSH